MTQPARLARAAPAPSPRQLREVVARPRDPSLPSPDAAVLPRRVALIGNFPPRRCGIATFTEDLHRSFSALPHRPTVDVLAMVDPDRAYAFPEAVALTVAQDDPGAYETAARHIREGGYDAVWVQHEFGIYGGPAGAMLLDLLDAIDTPVVTTLHTVLERPNDEQRAVMDALIARSERVVTMAEKGVAILRDRYGVDPARIVRVPHGVPDRPRASGPAKAVLKTRLNLPDETILTFGLLGPGKGLELMIDALPAILAQRPDARYVVLGATHPHLVAREGEAYREGLVRRAEALGVDHALVFLNRFAEFEDMLDHIQAADVYVTPYGNEAQITSGTLAYAVAMGVPVVSTPFWHAAELLSDGVGALVPFGDVDALAARIAGLLADDEAREAMAGRAWREGRRSLWSRVAESYRDAMTDAMTDAMADGKAELAAPRAEVHPNVDAHPNVDVHRNVDERSGGRLDEPAAARQVRIASLPERRAVPMLSLATIGAMTDDVGILQHTVFAIPDRRHGYCLDDNARALMLVNDMVAIGHPDPTLVRLGTTYATFVNHAWEEGRFRNFMGYDRRWLEREGSPDSAGRGFLAVAHAWQHGFSPAVRQWAHGLANQALAPMADVTSPRAAAFTMLGCAHIRAVEPTHREARETMERRGAHLFGQYRHERRDDWRWFEDTLSYDNARLPEALLAAAEACGREDWRDAALEAFEWLCGHQRNARGQFRPIGHESFGRRHAPPLPFDQQPLEATAQIDACAAAWRATGDGRWLERADAAHAWFHGENDLGLPVVQPETGVCFDGLHPTRVNQNQGAESVVAYQLASCAMLRLGRMADRKLRQPAVVGSGGPGSGASGAGTSGIAGRR